MPAYLKIDRAVAHLNALDDGVDGWFDKYGEGLFDLVGQPNSQRTKYLFRVNMLRPGPAGLPFQLPAGPWGIMVGDAIHCLRSTLDQIVYSCVPKADQGDHLAFPVCRTRRDWVTRAPARLWGVPRKYVAIIDRAQPYHDGDAHGKHPLSVLTKLWNLDKHEAIPTLAFVPSAGQITVTHQQGIASVGGFTFTGKPLVHDAVIVQVKIKTDDSGLEPQMKVKHNLAFAPAFGQIDGAPSISFKPVDYVLDSLIRFVRRTVDEFNEV